jgi:hypothetical protein
MLILSHGAHETSADSTVFYPLVSNVNDFEFWEGLESEYGMWTSVQLVHKSSDGAEVIFPLSRDMSRLRTLRSWGDTPDTHTQRNTKAILRVSDTRPAGRLLGNIFQCTWRTPGRPKMDTHTVQLMIFTQTRDAPTPGRSRVWSW